MSTRTKQVTLGDAQRMIAEAFASEPEKRQTLRIWLTGESLQSLRPIRSEPGLWRTYGAQWFDAWAQACPGLRFSTETGMWWEPCGATLPELFGGVNRAAQSLGWRLDSRTDTEAMLSRPEGA